jgi:hypothetical protein
MQGTAHHVSRPGLRLRRVIACAILCCTAASCGLSKNDEEASAFGGRASAGASRGGTPNATATGGGPSGGASKGGHDAQAGAPELHTSGGADADSGGASGPGAGTGGSEGGASGSEDCIDVCSLHGEACCDPALSCVKPGNHCSFEVLNATIGTIYEYDALVEKVVTLPQDTLISLTDADLESGAMDLSPSSRMRFKLTPHAASVHGAALDGAKYSHPYRLMCNDKLMYWGLTYDIIGAAALRYPVLDVARDAASGDVVLQLGASQGAWLLGPSSDATLAARLESAPLRAALCERGVLSVLDPEAKPITQ